MYDVITVGMRPDNQESTMTALIDTIERDCQVGIYDNCTAIARIYEDRTIATLPEVRWVGNTGGYHEAKYRITGRAHEQIKACMADGAEDSAWDTIYEAAR